jgi:RNA 2',3'-cyclic 3'-phosphodiesterase
MRLFLAINLPQELKSEVGQLIKELNDPGLKKVSPENLHITMKFLGEVDEKQADKIKQNLGEIKTQPFKISLAGIGFFPGENYPKVVWIGLDEGRQELISLQREIDSRMSDLGFKKEKIYEPHLTIARVKFLKDKKKLIEETGRIEIKQTFEARSLDLMESFLSQKGPEYKIVQEFEFNDSN